MVKDDVIRQCFVLANWDARDDQNTIRQWLRDCRESPEARLIPVRIVAVLAIDPQLGGQVAIKEIERSRIPNVADFFREAQAMFASECPNVVPIKYAALSSTHVCLAMPYLANGSLQDRIAAGPIDIESVIRLGQGLLNGLTRIHRANLLHLDLKPSNVLFAPNGDALVSDFGQSSAITATGFANLPAVYNLTKPPEAVNGVVATYAFDIYHAGLTLYRALLGEPYWVKMTPNRANLDQKILSGKWPDRGGFLPHVPSRLRTVVRKALSVDMKDRFQSAVAFADELAKVKKQRHLWHVALQKNDGVTWTSTPAGQSPRIVTLARSGTGANSWDVTHHTNGTGGLRAANRSEWISGASKSEAFKHLDGLFAALG